MTIQQYNDIFKNPVTKSMSITSSGGITITNTNICLEEMSLEESLCSDENLTIGACESACFKIRIADMNHNFQGELLTVNQIIPIDQDTDETIPYGVFKAISDKPTNDRRWRDLTCYDAMYDILNAEVIEWYNGLTFPMTMKNFRDSFFTYVGVTQATVTLVNDSFMIQGGFSNEGSLSGKTIITSICELNGVFGHISRQGQFEYISLPSADSLTLDWYMDGTGAYEDYTVQKITGITAKSSEEDVGTTVGTDTNVYIVQDNPLIYGSEGTQGLTTALTNLLNNVKDITYRPFNVNTYGNPMLPLGTNLIITTRNQTINSFLMTRVLSGIQSLKDSISAKGEKYRPTEVNSLRSETKRTKGKIHELVVTTDELRSTISSIEEIAEEASEDASDAKQTAEGVATDLSTNYFTKSETTSEISQSATSILSTVSQTYTPKASAIKTDTLHYLATSAGSGVTKDTPGWTTTVQSVTSTNKYLWTYHTYTYADDTQATPHTSDTTPVITGVYGDRGQQGQQGQQGPQGTTGTGVSSVTPLYYAGSSTPSKPTSAVTSTSTSGGQWTKAIPSLSTTYPNLYTCDQVYYTNGTYSWSDVVSDINSTTSYSEINQLKDRIVLKVDASGKIVQAELSADPSTGSEFKVTADNIDFIANGVMNLAANNLGISSTNFSINPTTGAVSINGSVTCSDGVLSLYNSTEDYTATLSTDLVQYTYNYYTYDGDTGTIVGRSGAIESRPALIIQSGNPLIVRDGANISGNLTVFGGVNAYGYNVTAKKAVIQDSVMTTELFATTDVKSNLYKLYTRYNNTDYEKNFIQGERNQNYIGWTMYGFKDTTSFQSKYGLPADFMLTGSLWMTSYLTLNNQTANTVAIFDSSKRVVSSSVTPTELGYLSGASSNIQTQLNGKQATITGGATTIVSNNLTASKALVSNANGKVAVSSVTATELGCLSGATNNIQKQIDGISSAVHPHIYGVKWDWANSNSPVLTRTDMSQYFVAPSPAISNGTGSSPFDLLYPWCEMQVVEDAEAGSLVRIPKFWYKFTVVDNAYTLQIADAPVDGFYVSPAHRDRGDGKGERDYVYVGRYHCDANYKSKTGASPINTITRATARTNIHALGDTIYQYDYLTMWTIRFLYLVEYASFDSQGVIGIGCSTSGSAMNMGYTDSMQYHTGTTASSRTTYGGMQYRHIEGLWDNVNDFVDGVYFGWSSTYVILNPNNFADGSNGSYLGSKIAAGGASSGNGVISQFSVGSGNGLDGIPCSVGKTANSNYNIYSCDYVLGRNYGTILHTGGEYTQSKAFGLFFENAWNQADLAAATVGCRLIKLP